MLRCASSFVIAAYDTVRLIPQDSRALPAAFLRSRPIFRLLRLFTRWSKLAHKCIDQKDFPRPPVSALTKFVPEEWFAAPLFLESPDALIDSQSKVDGVFPVFARQVDHFEEKKIGGMGHIMSF